MYQRRLIIISPYTFLIMYKRRLIHNYLKSKVHSISKASYRTLIFFSFLFFQIVWLTQFKIDHILIIMSGPPYCIIQKSNGNYRLAFGGPYFEDPCPRLRGQGKRQRGGESMSAITSHTCAQCSGISQLLSRTHSRGKNT